jgi:hypothetical protein
MFIILISHLTLKNTISRGARSRSDYAPNNGNGFEEEEVNRTKKSVEGTKTTNRFTESIFFVLDGILSVIGFIIAGFSSSRLHRDLFDHDSIEKNSSKEIYEFNKSMIAKPVDQSALTQENSNKVKCPVRWCGGTVKQITRIDGLKYWKCQKCWKSFDDENGKPVLKKTGNVQNR